VGPPEPPPAPALDESDLEGMRTLGASPQDLAAAQAILAGAPQPEPEEHFGVWDENWDTFLFFSSLAYQWSKVCLTRSVALPMGGARTWTEVRRDCLPATRVESAARLQGIPRSRWPALFADIQLMERAVLETDAKLAEAAALRGE
jgi:hypothetical protein